MLVSRLKSQGLRNPSSPAFPCGSGIRTSQSGRTVEENQAASCQRSLRGSGAAGAGAGVMSTRVVDQERVWRLLVDVVSAAHHRASHPDDVQLLDIIKAHRRLSLSRAVPRLVADEAYRTFLRLSVDPDTDWWAKLDIERSVSCSLEPYYPIYAPL